MTSHSVANKIIDTYPSDHPIIEEIEQRKQKLANLISLQLANPDLHRSKVKYNIDRLIRLGLGEQVHYCRII